MLNVRQAGDHQYHLAVAGNDFDGVFFVLSFFFPQDGLNEISDSTESVSEGFPTSLPLL